MTLSNKPEKPIENGTQPPKPRVWANNYSIHSLRFTRFFELTAAYESNEGHKITFNMPHTATLKRRVQYHIDAKRAALQLARKVLQDALQEVESELTAFNLEHGTGE